MVVLRLIKHRLLPSRNYGCFKVDQASSSSFKKLWLFWGWSSTVFFLQEIMVVLRLIKHCPLPSRNYGCFKVDQALSSSSVAIFRHLFLCVFVSLICINSSHIYLRPTSINYQARIIIWCALKSPFFILLIFRIAKVWMVFS